MLFLASGEKPHPWASRFGWHKSLISLVFNGKQLPGPKDLISLNQIERVNLAWLLNGTGAPYEVLPPPHWGDLELGPEVSYYLFSCNGGLQLPLVQVSRHVGHYPLVQVYSGLPVDFFDVLERLHHVRQPLYFAPDHPQVNALRKGWASNRILLGDDDQPGLLPEPSIYIDLSGKLPDLHLEDGSTSYLVNPKSTLPDPEREWVWALRGLNAEDQRLAVDLVRRLAK